MLLRICLAAVITVRLRASTVRVQNAHPRTHYTRHTQRHSDGQVVLQNGLLALGNIRVFVTKAHTGRTGDGLWMPIGESC
jgi:hypothetical protein